MEREGGSERKRACSRASVRERERGVERAHTSEGEGKREGEGERENERDREPADPASFLNFRVRGEERTKRKGGWEIEVQPGSKEQL